MKAFDSQIGGDHYQDMAIQPTEFIVANQLGFCEGNVIKYICRYQDKGGREDLEKAQHYIDILIEAYYGDEGDKTEKSEADESGDYAWRDISDLVDSMKKFSCLKPVVSKVETAEEDEWDKIPQEAEFVARDKGGQRFWYSDEPKADHELVAWVSRRA